MQIPKSDIADFLSITRDAVNLNGAGLLTEAYMHYFEVLFNVRRAKEKKLAMIALTILPHLFTEPDYCQSILEAYWYSELPLYQKLFTRRPKWTPQLSLQQVLSTFFSAAQFEAMRHSNS